MMDKNKNKHAALALGIWTIASVVSCEMPDGLINDPQPIRIMPIGDSITYGVGGSNGGYRGYLFTGLKDRWGADSVVSVGSIQDVVTGDHDGYPGLTISGVAEVIREKQSVGNVRPEFVLLMLGTNDIRNSSQAQIKSDLLAIIAEIRQQWFFTKVIVAKIPPWQYNSAYGNQHAAVDQIMEMGINDVYMCDNYTGFHGLTGDGVHPNDEGYQFIASRWFDVLVGIVEGL